VSVIYRLIIRSLKGYWYRFSGEVRPLTGRC